MAPGGKIISILEYRSAYNSFFPNFFAQPWTLSKIRHFPFVKLLFIANSRDDIEVKCENRKHCIQTSLYSHTIEIKNPHSPEYNIVDFSFLKS